MGVKQGKIIAGGLKKTTGADTVVGFERGKTRQNDATENGGGFNVGKEEPGRQAWPHGTNKRPQRQAKKNFNAPKGHLGF